ncbi:alpha/beta hydrolase [Streptomyces subrutilus]|uniref:Hydrolase n=1 Tax=Streptomyces subrutilus TaxID=36818 RepID=A0A918VHE8_9ACTN|nr:alpha/beta hydrolase [Streptomyces subrutilus]WSJ27909.1 alpha/beta hydrolase [Streptomyces subrutilus]GGZ97954.1 hydrolase [Streptomyces subrutilus]
MTTAPEVTCELTVRTDDGADLAVTVLAPLAGTVPAGDVVLVHGWAHARRVWGTVADRLIRAGHRVVLYDQRGHGASTLGRTAVSVERLGADLAAVLGETGAREAVVVGHSGGGFAALSYASTSPSAGRLRGLVLLGTAAHGQDTPDSEVKMMGSAVFSWALRRGWLGGRLLGSTMGKGVDPVVLDVNRQLFAGTVPRVRADFFRCTRGWDVREALASVTIPAVVVHGEGDKVIAVELARTLAGVLPRARFESVAGAGHMLPLERPLLVVAAVGELASR